jgi:hypothetical protein
LQTHAHGPSWDLETNTNTNHTTTSIREVRRTGKGTANPPVHPLSPPLVPCRRQRCRPASLGPGPRWTRSTGAHCPAFPRAGWTWRRQTTPRSPCHPPPASPAQEFERAHTNTGPNKAVRMEGPFTGATGVGGDPSAESWTHNTQKVLRPDTRGHGRTRTPSSGPKPPPFAIRDQGWSLGLAGASRPRPSESSTLLVAAGGA